MSYYHENVRSEQREFEQGVASFNQALENAKLDLEHDLNVFAKQLAEVETGKSNTLIPQNLVVENNAICLLNEGRLVFWTDNKFPVDQLYQLNTGVYQLKNGWYFINKHTIDEVHVLIGLHQIKKSFKQENQYLKNTFNDHISLNGDWELAQDSSKVKYASLIQKSSDSEVYLTFSPGKSTGFSHGSHHVVSVIEILIVLLVLYWVVLFCRNQKTVFKYVAVLFLIGFRLVLLYTSYGIHYKEFELFQPELYAASDFLPSFGDLILHLLFLALIVKLWASVKPNEFRKNAMARLNTLLSLVGVFALGMMLSYIVESLIKNSIIPLDLSDVSILDGHSLLSFVFLGLTVFGFYVFVKLTLVRIAVSSTFNEIGFILLIITGVCIAFSFSQGPLELSFLSWFWVVPLCFLILFKLNRVSQSGFSLLHYFPEMLLFSVLFTIHMENIKSTKQSNTIEQILEREAQERDPIAEFLIFKSSNKILHNVVPAELDSVAINKLLTSDYLSKYLNKFDVSWNLDGVDGDDNDQVKKGDHSSYTKINRLLYRKMTHGSMSYLSRIPFDNVALRILFTAKEIPISQGFPMLLASKSIEKMALDQGYSFAKYKDGKLMSNKGKYAYQTKTNYFTQNKNSNSAGLEEKIEGNFTHTILNKNGNAYVLTNNSNNYLSLVANLSYMLFFLSIILFLGGVFYRFYIEKVLFPKGFKSRLQYAILFILFFSTLVIALGSVYFLKNQYNKENFEAISEKIKSVDLALSSKFMQGQKTQVKQLELNSLAQTFFTDINIYDMRGLLIQTSQSNIFDAGILSTVQNPVAFREIVSNNKAIFVQIEHIEDMSYLSAYVPLYDKNEELVGCLNLPYFAKTNELQSEINGFLVALINMYLLLTVISIVIALFISNRIVKPLQFIQTKIANFNLKDTPEQIEWETDDEIGSLVKEYNRMVNELSESALRLAQAEREGAWKEMAQQVAHEIKNPLTPMKLNIQHFQMKWSGLGEEERKEGFAELTRNLVEQIDTLSAIAEQFSNFARIPEPKLSTVDLVTILKSSAGIYNGSNEVEVKFDIEFESAYITADKDQLLRIFNNVIKNAIQSIPQEVVGLVTVVVEKEKESVLVTVTDNGSGITQEQKHLIFQPNFTTKTSGMGLGLAMVKKMLESVEATIEFDSEVGVGTSFEVKFPNVKQ
ncbi:MAG: two-component system nitrogen regulation sensor histidine kinase NtrY [Saprospiraceae bacterium]|jgi:two-component system nitrogen regulation sensor histidine kinase NtrY